jgi:hypothetical protein
VILIENILLGELLEELYDANVVDMRVVAEEPDEEFPSERKYECVLQVKFVHKCGAVNWVHLGTPLGEYRCTGCTEWL